MPAYITAADLEDIALGAALLSCGGGGDPYYGRWMAAQALAASGPIPLLSPDELSEHALTAAIAFMGSSLILLEKLPNGSEASYALQTLAEHLKQPIEAIVIGEIGGVNALVAIQAAAVMKLPLVDADLVGRAVPELDMTLPALYGVPVTPMALVDSHGNRVMLHTVDDRWAEMLARALTVQTGGVACIAFYPMTGDQVRRFTAPGTLSMAWQLGRAVREAKTRNQPVDVAIMKVTSGRRVFKGKIIQLNREVIGRFPKGEALLDGLDEDEGHQLRLQFQNEYLAATRGWVLTAAVPDLIIVLDARSGSPIGTEQLRCGLEVHIISWPAPPPWYTPEGIARLGLSAFGYPVELSRI